MGSYALADQSRSQAAADQLRRADKGHPHDYPLLHDSAGLAGALNRGARVQPLLQLRQALNASPQMQSQQALQRALRHEPRPAPGAATVVQRRPLKDSSTGLWHDKLFPSLKLSQPEGFDKNQFLLGDGSIVWWEDNEYYLDRNCEQLYQPKGEVPVDRTHYIPLEAKGTTILRVNDVLTGFDEDSRALMKIPNPSQIAAVVQEIKASKAIYPIQLVRKVDGRYSLIGGRHRLLASQQVGFTEIPALVDDESSITTHSASAIGGSSLNINSTSMHHDERGDFVESKSRSMASPLMPSPQISSPMTSGLSLGLGGTSTSPGTMQIPPAKDAKGAGLAGYHVFGTGYQVHNESWIEGVFDDVKSNPTKLSSLADMMVVEFSEVDRKMQKIYLSYLIDIQRRLAMEPMFKHEADKLEAFVAEYA